MNNTSFTETSINIQSKPIRYVFFVKNREQILNAVKFCTHTWCGKNSIILKFPENKREEEKLKFALEKVEADVLVLPIDFNTEIKSYVEKFFTGEVLFLNEEVIRGFSDGTISISIKGRYISFIPELFKNGLLTAKRSPIIMQPKGPHSYEMALQVGMPSDYFMRILTEQQDENFSLPICENNLLKYLILFSHYPSPIQYTAAGRLHYSYRLDRAFMFEHLFESSGIINIFLEANQDKDIDTSLCYWNASGQDREGKLLMQRRYFLRNLNLNLQLIHKAYSNIKCINIVTHLSKGKAKALHDKIAAFFSKLDREIKINICYQGYEYFVPSYQVHWNDPISYSNTLTGSGTIKFQPLVPRFFENSTNAIAFIATVKYPHPITLPDKHETTNLLSFGLDNLSNPEEISSYIIEHLRDSKHRVRSTRYGIAGLASGKVEEDNSRETCCFYVPLRENGAQIINYYFSTLNYDLRANTASRFLKAFTERLGGIEHSLSLVRQGGIDILLAMYYAQGEDIDYKLCSWTRIVGLVKKLRKRRGTIKTDIVDQEPEPPMIQQLEELLTAGFIQRGYEITCSKCDFRDWYSLDSVGEWSICKGCLQRILTPIRTGEFQYQLSDIAAKFIRYGGEAVLMTASVMNHLDSDSLLRIGSDVIIKGKKDNEFELDLIWLTIHGVVISECKSYRTIDKKKLSQIVESIHKNIDVAIKLQSSTLFVGIVTEQKTEQLNRALRACEAFAAKKGVHLFTIVNNDCRFDGKVINPKFHHFLPYRFSSKNTPMQIGQKPSSYGGGPSPANKEIMRQWISELIRTEKDWQQAG